METEVEVVAHAGRQRESGIVDDGVGGPREDVKSVHEVELQDARLAHPGAPEVRSSVHERLRAQRPDGRCDDEEEQSQRYTAHDGPLPGVRCFARPFTAIPHSTLRIPHWRHRHSPTQRSYSTGTNGGDANAECGVWN